MATPLMRTALLEPYSQAKDAHPGLLLQRGYREHEAGNADNLTKTKHIQRLCAIPASSFYKNSYSRWVAATADPNRFGGVVLAVDGRLFIGLSGSGMLETGCALHHSYGVPYLPGSSIKGVVSHFVRHTVGMKGEVADALFGADADAATDYPDGLAGAVTFHDGWWVPGSASKPLVEEIVTTHHSNYYGKEGAEPALDSDSPIPNAQIAVQGAFLITVEVRDMWQPLVLKMVQQALEQQGMGAKTRAGYGRLKRDEKLNDQWYKEREKRHKSLEEQRQSARKVAEAAQKEAERKKMTPEQQERARLEEAFLAYQAGSEVQKSAGREAFRGQMNELLKQARAWSSESDRRAAADLLTRIYDEIGWTESGLKKDKREKQEQKRRAEIDQLRTSPSSSPTEAG